MTRSTHPNEEPFKIGKYTVIEQIKEGRFATFHLVERNGKKFVLAKLHDSLAQDAEFIAICKQAHSRYKRVKSPYILKIHEFVAKSDAYFVMEPLAKKPDVGTDVSQRLTLKRLENIASALEDMKKEGMVHGFLHPSCIRLRANGEAVLVGIEQMVSPRLQHPGFKGYRPPEEYESPTFQSDVYALALCSYWLWSGALPWEERCTVAEARTRKEKDQLRPLVAFGYPEDLSAVLGRALKADPSKRFQTPAALIKAFKNPAKYRPLREAESASPTIEAGKEQVDVKAIGKDIYSFLLRIAIIALVLIGVFFAQRYYAKSQSSTVQITQTGGEEPKKTSKKAYTLNVKGIALELIPIQNATVSLGALNRDRSASPDEKKHQITFSKGFYVSRTEVTQELWQEIMGENPSQNKDPSRPVDSISWFDAIQFCNTLSEKNKMDPVYQIEGEVVRWNPDARGFRLPTEAEWEYAAKGGESLLYSGSDEAKVGWYVQSSKGRSHAVGELAENAWSFVDMSGNVAEWVWDWYPCQREQNCEEPYPAESTDYKGPDAGTERVIRGGSFKDFKKELRNSARQSLKPSETRNYVGFRIAL